MGIKQLRMKQIYVRQCGSDKSKGIVIAGTRVFPCALGRSGLTCSKREGDGATPIGQFKILFGFYRADRAQRRACGIDLRRTEVDHGWCDAQDDRNYNRMVERPYLASHERMWRTDGLYDYCLVLDQNYSKRMRGRGSAIFFHLASDDYKPTEGCVAIKPSDMRWLLGKISRQTMLVIR